MGWKMVYNFLGIDEKTERNLPTFDQNVRTVYSNIRTVYPSKNHVTTHPDYRDGILWNRIFCGKAKLDPVHVCFYGDGL